MVSIYLIWVILALLFVVLVVVKAMKGGRATERHDGAVDAMFRRRRPSADPPQAITATREEHRQRRANTGGRF